MLAIILIKAAIVIILIVVLLAWALHSIETGSEADDEDDQDCFD